MKANPAAEQSDAQILEIARQLRVAYALKRTLRYSTTRDLTAHSESVAEHVFGLFFLAEYFIEHEQVGPTLDIQKLHSILLFHDFGEIMHGDVPYHMKTAVHEMRERDDARKIFGSLPEPLGTSGYESWEDYEGQKSPEARFAYALDKIEPLFELLDPINERSMKRLKFSYEKHIGKKFDATKDFPVMRRFLEAITADMLERGVFWDKDSDR